MTSLRLRQICLVARCKEQTVEDFRDFLDMHPVHGSGDLSAYGLPAKGPMSEGGRRVLEALGVENLVFAAGSDFLEVLFPTRPDGSTVRLMDRRGGDTGYMIILQTDDIGAFKALAEAEGVRVIHEADFPHYRDIHLHPKDTGGALLSMAQHVPENIVDGPWYPAGTAWEKMPGSGVVAGIVAAELQSEDPQRLSERWGRLLGRQVQRNDEQFEVALDDGTLRFVRALDGRGEGFSGFDVRVHDRARLATAAAKRGLSIRENRLTVYGMRIGLVG